MAAAYFSNLCKKAERSDIKVCSAGTFAGNGIPASKNAVLVMKDYNIDLSVHRSQMLTRDLINDIDKVLTMTEGHRQQVLRVAPDAESKTHLLMDFACGGDAADPFGGSYELYKECFTQMKQALDNFFKDLDK